MMMMFSLAVNNTLGDANTVQNLEKMGRESSTIVRIVMEKRHCEWLALAYYFSPLSLVLSCARLTLLLTHNTHTHICLLVHSIDV